MNISLKFSPETIPESLLLSLLGMAVVMLVLVVLMYAIRGQSKLLELFAGRGKAAVPAPAPAVAPAPAAVSGPPAVKLIDVEEKTAALIMAIVADETDIPLNELQFISIRPL